jgi:hypothetical protein
MEIEKKKIKRKNNKNPVKKNKNFYIKKLKRNGDTRTELTLSKFTLPQLRIMSPKLDDAPTGKELIMSAEEILEKCYEYLEHAYTIKTDGTKKMDIVTLSGLNKYIGFGYIYVQKHPHYIQIKEEIALLLEEHILVATSRGDIPNQFASFFLKNRYEYSDNKNRDEIYKEELKLKKKANEIISNREDEIDLSDEELLAIISKDF